MPKPASVPTWATDASYDDPGEDWDTEPTKIDPGAGKRATGWLPTEVLPADMHNHEMNLLGQWAGWLDDLFDEDGEHSFQTGSPPLRSIVVSPRGNLFEGEWDYEFDIGLTGGLAFFSDINSARFGMWLENVLPNGATLQSVSALVRPGAARAGTDRMSLAWYSQSEQYTGTEDVVLTGPSDTDFDDGGTGIQLLTMVISEPVTTDTALFAGNLVAVRRFVMLSAGNTGAASPDAFFSWVFVYNDAPGLSNR